MAKRGPQYSQKEHRRASWYHDAPGGYSKRGGEDSDNFGEQRTVNREILEIIADNSAKLGWSWG
jgi:hypothetical protein